MIITNGLLLKKECKNVSIFEGQEIILKLIQELNNSHVPGIGLAANQIGIDAKVCIIRTGKFSLDLINPEIIDRQGLSLFKQEGCLSFPNENINTARYHEIVVKDDLHPNGIVAVGLEAVVVQHEVGHLYGEVMYDFQVKIPSGPNEKCWCHSERKYKKCCEGKEIVVR